MFYPYRRRCERFTCYTYQTYIHIISTSRMSSERGHCPPMFYHSGVRAKCLAHTKDTVNASHVTQIHMSLVPQEWAQTVATACQCSITVVLEPNDLPVLKTLWTFHMLHKSNTYTHVFSTSRMSSESGHCPPMFYHSDVRAKCFTRTEATVNISHVTQIKQIHTLQYIYWKHDIKSRVI